ncbi:hypothetical protein J6590_094214 [Homalodisca vitripennis]|nr:hypothetical protein J6590_094214 [Homalodisca vitripennis]
MLFVSSIINGKHNLVKICMSSAVLIIEVVMQLYQNEVEHNKSGRNQLWSTPSIVLFKSADLPLPTSHKDNGASPDDIAINAGAVAEANN